MTLAFLQVGVLSYITQSSLCCITIRIPNFGINTYKASLSADNSILKLTASISC